MLTVNSVTWPVSRVGFELGALDDALSDPNAGRGTAGAVSAPSAGPLIFGTQAERSRAAVSAVRTASELAEDARTSAVTARLVFSVDPATETHATTVAAAVAAAATANSRLNASVANFKRGRSGDFIAFTAAVQFPREPRL